MHKFPHIPLRRAALLAAAGAALAAPAAASAAPGFTSPSTLDGFINHRIGFANGEETGTHFELVSKSPVKSRVVVTTRRAGGSFSEQLVVPTAGGRLPVASRIAVAPNGAAALVWDEVGASAPNATRYRAAYRTPSGTWEAPVTIASDPGSATADPVVAIGPNGTAVAAISHAEADSPGELKSDSRIDAIVHGPSGGWDAPTRLSKADRSAVAPEAGVDAAGNVTLTYGERYQENPDRGTALVRRHSVSNGLWSSADDLTESAPDHHAIAPVLDVAPDGRAVISLQSNASGKFEVVAAVRESASGGFGKLVPIGPADAASSTDEAAGIAPDGTAYVAYSVQSTTPEGDHIGLVRAAPGGSFTAPQRVSSPQLVARTARIAFAGNDAVAAWSGSSSGEDVVQGTRWKAGSANPDAFQELDPPSGDATLEDAQSDGEGSVEIVWSHLTFTTRVAAFDASGPGDGDASVPAAAVVGEAVPMKASFVDRWSALAPGPEWSFGDGATGSGAEVSHAYAEAGDYTVTVRSADVLGNARERTFPIHVSAAAVVSNPPAPAPAPAVAPKVKLKAPHCSPKLRAVACRKFLTKRSTWKLLRGTASGAARVQLTVKRAGVKKARVVNAKLVRGRWTAKAGKLKAGRVTFTVRAFAADGSPSKPVAKKVRLR
jgi:hypothetical protein